MFAVQTSQGEVCTRSGSLVREEDGAIATAQGYKVLDSAGSPIEFEDTDVNIRVYADGRMEVDGEQRSSIGVFEFLNPQGLRNVAGNLFSSSETPAQSDKAKILQGVLEKS